MILRILLLALWIASQAAGAEARDVESAGEQIPAEVSAVVDRLLSKPSWNARDITSDLQVLTTFEEPKRGITAYDSDGSVYSSAEFRILGITWDTYVDPDGNAWEQFHRRR